MNEKKENGNKKKKTQLNGEKRFYLFTAIGCAVALVAIVVIAAVVSNAGKVDSPAANVNSNSTVNEPVDNPQEPEDEGNEPVGTLPEGMVAPVETVAVLNDYGFYHNKTLNT